MATETPDPIPPEIRDRIVRADEAYVAASGAKGLDCPHQLAAALRELADAFKAAYRYTKPRTVVGLAVLHAYSGLKARADEVGARVAESVA